MQKKSAYGRGLIEDNWQEMEFHALRAAFDAGVRVPEPYFLYENVLFMELLVDGAGAPASRLADFTFTAEEATALHQEVFLQVKALLGTGRIHGDLLGLQRPHGGGRSDHHRPAPGRRGGGQQQRPSDPAARSAQPDRAPGPLRRPAAAPGRLRRRALSPSPARDLGQRHRAGGGSASSSAAAVGGGGRRGRDAERGSRRPRQGAAPRAAAPTWRQRRPDRGDRRHK